MADDLADAPWATIGGDTETLPDAPWASAPPARTNPMGGGPLPPQSASDKRIAAGLQANTGGDSYLERQIYSNMVKGVAGLPGVPGYLIDAGARAGHWAGKKLRPYVTGQAMSPEEEKALNEDFEQNRPANYLPTPETFIKPVEQYVTGPLPEEDPDKPIQNIAAAGLGAGMFGPLGAASAVAGKTAETLVPDEYKEAAGLVAGAFGPKGMRSAGDVAKNAADRIAWATDQVRTPASTTAKPVGMQRMFGTPPPVAAPASPAASASPAPAGSLGAAAVAPAEQAKEFGIPLSRGQAEQDMDAIRFEDMAARGAHGKPAQDVAAPWFQNQFEKINEAGQGINERVARGETVAEGPGEAAATINSDVAARAAEARQVRGEAQQRAQQAAEAQQRSTADQRRSIEEALSAGHQPIENVREAGETVAHDVREQAAADRDHYRDLYNEAFALPGEFHAGAFEGVGRRIQGELSSGDSPVIIDDVTTPMASRAIRDLDNISNLRIQNRAAPGGQPNPEDIVGVNLRGVDQARKRLVAYYQAARGGAPLGQVTPDVRAMGRMLDAFDNQVEHAISNGLFSGDERALGALRDARAAYRNYAQTYRPRGAGDDVGAAIRRIVDRQATPEETANMILGSGRLGTAGLPVRIADRLEQILGRDSNGWSAVRQAMWQRASQVRNAAGEIDPLRSAANIEQFAQSSLGRRMFEPNELAAMRGHARAVQQLERSVEMLPETAAAGRAARGYEAMFGGEGIGGPQQAVFRRIVEGAATPEETATAVFNAIGSGNPGNAVRMIDAIERIVGSPSPTMAAMRQGVWQRLTQAAAGKDQPGAQKLAQSINEFLNGRGRSISERLYTPAELELMQRYADVVKRTVIPKYARTNSDTAPAVAGMVRRAAFSVASALTGHGILGRIAHAGVEKLIAGTAAKISDAAEARKVAASLDYTKQIPQSAASQGGLNQPGVGRQPLERTVIRRDARGRPIETKPLRMGAENKVLEAGAARANPMGRAKAMRESKLGYISHE